MTTLTYCKGLPTPIEELNPIGFTELEMLLTAYSKISHLAVRETVDYLLAVPTGVKFEKSKWNTYLQTAYQINKRQAGGIIALAQGKVDSAKECRKNHIKQLEEQLKSAKKSQLREKGRKYARMLSQWAYSRFYHLLESILSNRGISLFKRNAAYTSLIGLVKYARMYGLSSDIAAAIAIARRGMNLSERLPRFMSAYLGVNPRKPVGRALNQLNKFIGRSDIVNRRHDYYNVSNWESVVKLGVE